MFQETDINDVKPQCDKKKDKKSEKHGQIHKTFSLSCVSWYLQQIPPVVLLTVHFLLWPQQP